MVVDSSCSGLAICISSRNDQGEGSSGNSSWIGEDLSSRRAGEIETSCMSTAGVSPFCTRCSGQSTY